MRATKLKTIEQTWGDCSKCPAMAKSPIVFGYGNPDAKLVFVGGSPRTDIESEEMLDAILKAVKIPKEDIWITNTCLCRAPEVDERSRAPNKKEINNCRPRFQEEMGIINPKVLVLAGNAALFMATGKRGITKHRGWIIPPDGKFYSAVYATLHPAAFFSGGTDQVALKKKMAWEDWKKIAEAYHGIPE
jgi:uracil-DNA glycosylase family 4